VELNTVVFDSHGEKLAITGFGGIADVDVKKTLEQWKPKPVDGAFNIFMFHQSLKEAVYDVNDEFISVNELPKGFDFYLNGHIHQWQWMEDKKLLIAGSTALTQQKENETDGKCFFIIETNPFKLTPMKIERQRPFYFKKFDFESATQENVSNEIRNYLKSLPASEKKTLVKIKLAGKMELGRRSNQLDLSEFKENEHLIISIDNELESDEFKKLVAELRELHQSKKSVDEMGMDLIRQLLAQTNYKGIDVKEIIEPLADGDNDFVMQKILSKAEKNQS
jgi:hypothetical protein